MPANNAIERVDYLREIADPDQTLPYVYFEPRAGKTYSESVELYTIVDDDFGVGEATVLRRSGLQYLTRLVIDKTSRSREYATATLLYAARKAHEQGEDFSNDLFAVDAAEADIWRGFAELGIAKEEEPFTPLQPHYIRNKPRYFKGRFIIPYPYDQLKFTE